MSVLRSLESKLAGLVEGTFSRAFKSEVRPVEIARKLAKEMDEHKVQSLSRVYAPNEYAVWLSPDDRKQFEGYEDELAQRAGRLPARARAAREDRAASRSPQIDVQDRRAAAAGRVRHPGAARAPARARARAAEPGRRGPHDGLLDVRARSRSRCASPTRGAASARLHVGRPRGARRLARAPCSAARATATSCSTTPTSPAATPRCGRRAGRGSSTTSAPPTASRSTAAASDGPQSLKRGRRDRARHLAGDVRAGVADGLDPIAVALKFGFLAVLYLFLLWVARSALKDLRRGTEASYTRSERGLRGRDRHVQRVAPLARERGTPKLRVNTAAGLRRAPPMISARERCSGAAIRRTSGSRTDSRPRSTRASSRRGM